MLNARINDSDDGDLGISTASFLCRGSARLIAADDDLYCLSDCGTDVDVNRI